jgi:phosphoribosylglycinamide formyltransferase-1
MLKAQAGYFNRAQICCLLSNRPSAPALDLARGFGIHAAAFPPKSFASFEHYEQALVQELERLHVDWVVLAGYMRLVGPTMLDRFPSRIVNIHPSLLPSFPGLHAQDQAFQHGVKVTGCTVHFVDGGLDSGPIIGQRAVPVLEDDTPDTLSARILEQEHQLFAESLRRVTEEHWRIDGRRVIFEA